MRPLIAPAGPIQARRRAASLTKFNTRRAWQRPRRRRPLNARVAELEQRLEASARSETRRSLALGALVLAVVGVLALHGQQPSSHGRTAETIGEAPQTRTSRRLLQLGAEESEPIIAPPALMTSRRSLSSDLAAVEQAIEQHSDADLERDLERLLAGRALTTTSFEYCIRTHTMS